MMGFTYCHTCKRNFHYLGIARHRAMHRDKKENCKISYRNGTTHHHVFDGTWKRKGEKHAK